MSTGSFPGDKVARAWPWPPTPSIAEVKEKVVLYFYSHFGLSWLVLGWTLPFLIFGYVFKSRVSLDPYLVTKRWSLQPRLARDCCVWPVFFVFVEQHTFWCSCSLLLYSIASSENIDSLPTRTKLCTCCSEEATVGLLREIYPPPFA